MTNSNLRDVSLPIKVYVTDQERKDIKRMAKKMRMSVSHFLRTLGVGHTPRTTFDKQAMKKLIKLHADEGRLGGLLKLCLTELKGEPEIRAQIRALLKDVDFVQSQIAEWIALEKKRT